MDKKVYWCLGAAEYGMRRGQRQAVIHRRGRNGRVIHSRWACLENADADRHARFMTLEIPPDCRSLIASQSGVISRSQGAEFGLAGEEMRNRVRFADWQRVQRGVYATFSGDLRRETQLWAVLLRAGSDAVLSHQTAAELDGLIKQPSSLIHLTVPHDSNPARYGKIPGVVVHRSRILGATRHPMLAPARTRIEDTVLDLIEGMDDPADRYDLICRAIGGQLTTAARLRRALDRRSRFRYRRETEFAFGDAGQGALSNLERWYLRGVERRHMFPVATRQARVRVGGRSIYLDNLYEDYLVCVELDGTAAHPAGEQWGDKRRDRRNLAGEKIVTMRFGYLDLRTEQAQCQTAGEVVSVLRGRGPWVGRSCRMPNCPVLHALCCIGITGNSRPPAVDRGWFAASAQRPFRFGREHV
jgi:hypothetical protein